MDFTPLLSAEFPIPAHAIAAFVAMALGLVQFALRKGTRLHRGIGYVWVICMVFVGISGFFIHELRMFGPFSPIHFLSAYILWALYSAVSAARRHDIRAHKRGMILTYVLALILTGLFTFYPGRVMHQVVFGSGML